MKNVMGSLILSALSLSVLSCGKSTGASQSKVQNIFGNDDRVKLTDTDYPWRTIVKIRSTNDASLGWSGCTGTLVGPDLLLTASHCLQDREGKIHSDIRFYPNFIDGKGPYFVQADTYWRGTKKFSEDWKNDWALVRLNVRIGDSLGYMGLKNVDTATLSSWGPVLTAAGHAGDFGDGQSASVHNGCSVIEEVGERLYSDCDFNNGSSGGPVFATFDDGPKIVGVISAQFLQDDGTKYPSGVAYSRDTANTLVKASNFFEKLIALKDNSDGVLNRTYLNICNNSNTDTISAAVAYSDATWHTKGWYNVKKGECESISMGENYNGNVYVHGHGNGLTWGASPYTFCVNPRSSFDYESADTTCLEDEDDAKVRFGDALALESRKVNTFTFN